MSASCDAPIESWLVAGPFALDTGTLRLDRSDVGEPAVLFASEGDSVPGVHAMRWRAEQSDSLGRIDLYSVFREPTLDDRAAYALTYIASPEARTVRLAVESDDDVVIWLNGRRVHRHEIGRELRSGADTIALALAPGTNRLLYRVVNRGGGFGLGGRLLSASRDPIGDLRAGISPALRDAAHRVSAGDTARGPAPRGAVTLGPVSMASRARIGSALTVELRVCATRWSDSRSAAAIAIGSANAPIPASHVGEARSMTLDADWSELARGVLAGGARAMLRRDDSTQAQVTLPVSASALLELLSRPMQIDEWSGARRANGAADVRVDASADSTTRRKLASIVTNVVVPTTLGGLTLEAEVAEFGETASVRVNGASKRADSMGRVALCTPCRAGAHFSLEIAPHGTWWDPPRIRVRELGWTEIHDGAQWARYFTGDTSVPVPDSAVAMELLRASLDSSKGDYHATLAQWLARLDPASRRIRRDTIDIVGHSHIDAAWLWRWRDGRDEVQRTWATTTKLMAKYPDMHFAASSAQYYAWLEETDPALLARIRALAKEERWDPVGGWWVESDANLPSGESLVRQALYGQRTFMRLFGKPARVAWLPNTFGFAWSLPQILRKSGFEFFVTEEMRWNDTNHWPSRLNSFWWEGPDGSRIFTDMVYAYDHDLSPQRLAKEFVVTRDSSASPRMMTVYGVGDHGGGPTMAMLDRARDLERIPTFPVVRDASPDSSLSRMRRDAVAGPVLRDELYLEYHRGTYTTQAAIKRRNRSLESLLGAAEAAAALAPAQYPHDSLRTAWELVLFNQFHDILPGTSAPEVYTDANVDYTHAESIAQRVLRESLVALADSIDTRPRSSGEVPYVVFNASGQPRTGIIRLPSAAGASARDASGRTIASTVEDSSIAIRVPDVPAFGLSLIFVGGKRAAEADSAVVASPGSMRVLENTALRVEIDPATGNIARLYDRVHRHELLARGAGDLILFEDHPQLWDAWNIDNLAGKRAIVDQAVQVDVVRRTALGLELKVHRSRDSARVTEQYALRDSPARLDIAMSIDWHETHRLLKLALPLAFHVDSTRAEIPYASISRPTRPLTRRDSARFEVPMQRWLDASANGFGVAVANDGKYGYSASADTMFITLLRSPKSPDPHADMGMQTVTLSIVPHSGDWRAPEIWEAATELNSPMVARAVPPHTGAARAKPWLSIEPSTVAVGALKRAEDDERVIVRVIETTGRATTAHMHFSTPVDASEDDLLERALAGGYRGSGQDLAVPLGPFEIKTLIVSPMRPH